MTVAIVQSKNDGNSGGVSGANQFGTPSQPVFFASAPTAGNLLVAIYAKRDETTLITPSGWTNALISSTAITAAQVRVHYKIAAAGESATLPTISDTVGASSYVLYEVSGLGGGVTLDGATASIFANTATATIPALTPSAGRQVWLLAAQWKNIAGPNPGPQTLTAFTAGEDTGYAGLGNRLRLSCWYRTVTSASGSYGNVALSSSGDAGDDGHTLLLGWDASEPGIWIDWDADGFDTDTTSTARLVRLLPAAVPASDNITPDVMSVAWSRGASSDHVSAAGPGNATIIVQNSDGKYNPDNSASSLYGKLVPGRPVWCGAIRTTGALSGSGTVRGFFAGHVTEIVPTPVPGGNPWAEILCEDPLGNYRRATASVAPSQTRSQGDFRGAILDAIDESSARRSLETEGGMLPFSAADTRGALALLEDLNRATGSRHFVAPADSKEGWYAYYAVNRLHKLTAAADEAINADDVTALSGYRVTNDTIVNEQRATVSPIDFSPVNQTVWTYGQTPLTVTSARNVTIWAEFADYVFSAAVVVSSSGGTLTTTLTSFGTSAKLVLHVSGAPVTIGSLRITGQALLRGDDETVLGEDAASRDHRRYGPRAGSDITSDWIGQTGAAQGLVDFLVWKFREPLKRPTVTIAGKSGTTLDTLLDRDLFDVVTLTVDRLNVVSRRFEIIGLRGRIDPGLYWEISYELQETPNQAALDFWVWDTSSWNGPDLWAPF